MEFLVEIWAIEQLLKHKKKSSQDQDVLWKDIEGPGKGPASASGEGGDWTSHHQLPMPVL